MENIKIEKLLQNGCINLFKTGDENQQVLVLIFKGKNITINLVNSSIPSAYVDRDLTSEKIDFIMEVLTKILENKIYAGFRRFNIKTKDEAKGVVEFNNEITGFIPPAKGKKSAKAVTELKNQGFVLNYNLDSTKFILRTYEEVNKTDEVASLLTNNNIEKLKKDNISLEFDPKMTEVIEAFRNVSLLQNDSPGILFTGPTGTGKSVLATIFAAKLKAPLVAYQITAGTQPDDLAIKYGPNDEEGKNHFKTIIGPLLKAYSKGYICVLEEANMASPGVLALLNRFTDGSAFIELEEKIYTKHPNFILIMTMNPGYADTQLLNMALKNRFPVCLIPKLDKTKYVIRCRQYSELLGHVLPAEFYNELYDFSELIEQEGSKNSWNENIAFSFRNAKKVLLSILSKRCSFTEFQAALSINYLNLLCLDNDNSEKLIEFKKNLINIIKTLYDLYDYKEVEEVELELDLDEFLRADSSATTDDETKMAKTTIDTDALFAKFED